MEFVYLLQHSYEQNGCDETKIIGSYSSIEKANEVIERFRKLPGFVDYQDAFFIDKYDIDKDNWVEGFISTSE